MNVRSRKPWDTKHGVTQYLRWNFFVLDFDVCMIGKTTLMVICIHKRVEAIVLGLSIKFCDEPGQAILKK